MSCDIYPPDESTELGQVRYRSGDCEIDINGRYIVPDAVIDMQLENYLDKSQDLRLYYTTLYTMNLMKSKFAPTAARTRQREGAVEVEFYGKERYDVLCARLKELKKNPEDLFPSLGSTKGIITIGGTSKDEMKRVKSNPDSNGSPCSIDQTNGKETQRSLYDEYRLEDS